jgi:hypothetical protein
MGAAVPWSTPPKASSTPCATPAAGLPDGSVVLGSSSDLPPAPRVLWTYWKEGQLPPIVQACILTWQRFHPDLRIQVVTPATVTTFLPDLHLGGLQWLDSPARESDVVRLHLLAAYGGVWLDASCLLAAPLDFCAGVFAARGPEFTGFYMDMFTTQLCWPVVESWAFAARPGSPFVRAWLQEFMAVPNDVKGVARALHTLKDTRHVDTQAIRGEHYLFIHVAAQAVMQSGTLPLSMHLFSAVQGPYKYVNDAKGNTLAAVQALMDNFHPRRAPQRYSFYKLRNRERAAMLPAMQTRILQRAQHALRS